MNKFRRIIVFILTLALCFQVTVPALAANSIGVTYEAIFDKTEVYTSSEDQTITLTIRANKVIEMDSLSAKAAIPEGFELINMVNEDIGLTSANGNLTTGVVGWYQSDSETVSSQNLVILTYKVPAGTLAGTYDFRFYIDTISSYWEIWEDGNTTVPATLTILEAAEEECDHQDKEYIYDDNDDGTHKVTCECGETIAEAEPHDYTTGTADNTCICGAAEPVELVEVTVYFIDATPYGDGIEVDEEDAADGTFYHTFYANPDEDLVVDVKPMGDWPYVGYDIWDDGGLTDEWISADGVTQLVVPKEWFDYEGRWIEVYGHSYDVIDLNGGALGEGFPEEWLDGYDSETNTLKLAVGSRTSWTPAMLGFEREGYTLVGAESGETTFGMEDDIEAVPEGRSLKLIWKADHVCAHDHYEYYDATGHQSVCSCGEVIGDLIPHEADETGYCDCGAFALVFNYTGGKNAATGDALEPVTMFCKDKFSTGIDLDEAYWAQINSQIVKEGYTAVALAFDVDGNDLYNGEDITGPATLYLIWVADHVCGTDTLTHVAAQDATCIATGIVEHWECTCGKLYSDNAATDEITEDDIIAAIDPTNHAGEKEFSTATDLELDITHHSVWCDACGELWDEENPDELHVAGENRYCECGYFELCIDFNGGKISTTPPLEGLDQEVWKALVEATFGGFDATEFCQFGTGFSRINMGDGTVVKDGYNYVGLAYDAAGTQPYNGEEITEPTILYIIWESDHVCEHHHYDTTDDTHQSVCSCSELIGEAEAHDYTSGTAEHTCICGKVEEFTLSISTFNEKGEGVQEEIDVPFGAKLADYYLDTPDYVSSGLLHEFQSWIAWTWENQDDATMAEYTGDTMPASDVNMYSTYTFTGWVTDENGTAYYVKSEIQKTGKTEIDGAWYYLDPETGIRAESKLFVLEDGYYYAKPTGQLAVSGDCYVVNPDKIEKDGEVIAEGTYTFDAEGRIIWPEVTDKNGIYKEADGLYYYVDGERTYAGLIEYTGHLYNEDGSVYEADAYNADYIYVRTSGILATGKLWITKNNGKLPSTNYNFDAEGRMDRREGFIQEGEETYYYENGNRTHKGLMLKDGSFYYVNSSGLVIANRTYWITFTNGFEETHGIVEGSYQFSADGKMIIPEVKNGIYEEDGKLVFYKNDSKPCYAGLIRYTGDLIKEDGTVVAGVYNNNWIYVRTSGEVATGKLWITKNNGEMPSASYNFDVYGRMKNGIYEEGQNLMYYQDGNLVYAGLINYTGDLIKEDGTVVAGVYDGAYIYVRTGGKLARDVKYWPTITNDNWVITHQHTFDSNGVMLDPDI